MKKVFIFVFFILIAKLDARVLLEPVGSITIDLAGSSDTRISVPYLKAIVAGGEAVGVEGNVITTREHVGVPFSVPHFIVIHDGAQRGMWFDVMATDGDSVTVDLRGYLLTESSFTFRVYEHWTLSNLFSDAESIHATERLGHKQTLVLFPDRETVGVDLAPGSAYYYYAGGAPFGTAGWRKVGDPYTAQDNTIIAPATPLIVRHNCEASTQLTIAGNVLATESLLPIDLEISSEGQDVSIALNVPVKISLLESNLYQLGIVEGSGDGANVTDYLFLFDNEAAGQNKQAEAAYFYYTGGQYGAAGWRDTRDMSVIVDNVKLLEPGQSYVLRKGSMPSSGTVGWRVLAPYLENVE